MPPSTSTFFRRSVIASAPVRHVTEERMTRCGFRRAALLTLMLAATALLAYARVEAQQINATITGTVSDPQGGVLPGVTVAVLNIDTNVSSETVTNSEGTYAVQQLPPGRYKVSGTLQGFKT